MTLEKRITQLDLVEMHPDFSEYCIERLRRFESSALCGIPNNIIEIHEDILTRDIVIKYE